MPCVRPRIEWTIDTKNDNSSQINQLVFCLTIQGGTITGAVSETTTGVPRFLSYVSGTDQPVDGLNVTFRTHHFVWDTCRVVLSGIAFPAANPRRFIGRFAAYAVSSLAPSEDPDSVTIMSPGDGDTGTGNGTQT